MELRGANEIEQAPQHNGLLSVWVGLPLSDQSASPRETMKHSQSKMASCDLESCFIVIELFELTGLSFTVVSIF